MWSTPQCFLGACCVVDVCGPVLIAGRGYTGIFCLGLLCIVSKERAARPNIGGASEIRRDAIG